MNTQRCIIPLISLGLLLFSVACNSNKDVIHPNALDASYNTETYGTQNPNKQKVDICVPNTLADGHGIIIFIHGGGWAYGGKDCKMLRRQSLETSFFLKVFPQHPSAIGMLMIPLSPTDMTSYRMFTMQLKRFALLQEQGITPMTLLKILIVGESSGGHLALMYALSIADQKAKAVASISAPTNLNAPDLHTTLSNWRIGGAVSTDCGRMPNLASNKNALLLLEQFAAGNTSELYEALSPVAHLDSDDIPVFVMHGENDDKIDFPSQAQDFIDALDTEGITFGNLFLSHNHVEPEGDTFTQYADEIISWYYDHVYP